MHCDIWAMVYEALQQRTGRLSRSHQYDHNQCPFHNTGDALAKQAAVTHQLQLRPCVLRRAGDSLAPAGSHTVRPKGNAAGVSEQHSVSAPQQARALRRPREPLAPLGITQNQVKKKYTTAASTITNFGAPTRSVNASR